MQDQATQNPSAPVTIMQKLRTFSNNLKDPFRRRRREPSSTATTSYSGARVVIPATSQASLPGNQTPIGSEDRFIRTQSNSRSKVEASVEGASNRAVDKGSAGSRNGLEPVTPPEDTNVQTNITQTMGLRESHKSAGGVSQSSAQPGDASHNIASDETSGISRSFTFLDETGRRMPLVEVLRKVVNDEEKRSMGRFPAFRVKEEASEGESLEFYREPSTLSSAAGIWGTFDDPQTSTSEHSTMKPDYFCRTTFSLKCVVDPAEMKRKMHQPISILSRYGTKFRVMPDWDTLVKLQPLVVDTCSLKLRSTVRSEVEGEGEEYSQIQNPIRVPFGGSAGTECKIYAKGDQNLWKPIKGKFWLTVDFDIVAESKDDQEETSTSET